MPIFEYRCTRCQKIFEKILSYQESLISMECEHCQGQLEKCCSAFKVSGRGDVRESTQHGCHDCHVGHKH